MSFDYKLVAFDLDGTLSESKLPLTKEMGVLLSKLSKTVKVVVISGGSFDLFSKQLIPFIESSSNIILMPTDGSEMFEYDKLKNKWEMTLKEIFPEEIKKEVKKIFNK